MEELIRVLYVEDNTLDCDLVRDALERESSGFKLRTASSRSEFEKELASGSYDVVLTDFNILGFNGLEVLDAVRARDASVPVIILTGTGTEEIAVEALRKGADDYVIKTVSHIQRLPSTIRSVIERRRLEAEKALALEALYETRDFLEALFTHASAPTVVTGPTGKIQRVNPALEKLCGREARELVDRPLECLFPAESRGQVLDWMRRCSENHTAEPVELPVLRPDQTVRTVLWTIAHVSDRSGRLLGAIAQGIDITEQKRMEAEARRFERQFLQAQKLESIGRFAGSIAHDFNNLLTVISGYAALAIRHLAPADPLCTEIQEIRKAAERATELTRQLLAFSRQQPLAPQVFDLNALIGGMRNMLSRLIGEDVELDTCLCPGEAFVKADPGQIEQVIVNLAVNARDAMPEGGRLLIATEIRQIHVPEAEGIPGVKPGVYVAVRVRDSGHGMDEETVARIFEPFFTTKDPGKGTGLGLSTVYGIVNQSGGGISVESVIGQGTTFTIYLPVTTERPCATNSDESNNFADFHGSETILFVEDQPELLMLGCEVLKLCGYKVLPAANGGEALLHCERHDGEIHLLVSDIVMPGISGRVLAERLLTLRPNMRVLFTSGYAAATESVEERIRDGEEFLPKPYQPLSLARKVRQVLDRACLQRSA